MNVMNDNKPLNNATSPHRRVCLKPTFFRTRAEARFLAMVVASIRFSARYVKPFVYVLF